MSAGAEVYAAFARVAEAVRGSVFGFLVPDDVFKECEVALANGLSRKQALNVRSYLDSEEERARARMALRVVASDQDAVTLLSWLAAEVEAAMKTEGGHEEAPAFAEATAGKHDGTKTEGPTDGTDGADGTDGTHGARILWIKQRGDDHITLATAGCEDWPKRGDEKETQAKLYIKGVFVDSLTPGQMNGAAKTMENAFQHGEHSLDVRQGEAVEVFLKAHDGRKSAVFPWVWPFRTT